MGRQRARWEPDEESIASARAFTLAPPSARRRRATSQWNDRHHVLDSKHNSCSPCYERCFFDNLLSLRVRGGVYVGGVHEQKPKIFDTSSSPCADEIRQRTRTRLARSSLAQPVVAWERSLRAASTPREYFATPLGGESGDHWKARGMHPATPSPIGIDALISTLGLKGLAPACDSPAPLAEEIDLQGAVKKQPEAADAPKPKRMTRRQLAQAHMDKLLEFSEAVGQEPYHQFLQWARMKFGELAHCWRQLDKDENMVVSRVEFINSLRALGYCIPAKEVEALWRCLDRDGTGSIAFLHFDPPTAIALSMVKVWCSKNFGGVVKAAASFDRDRSGSISLNEFEVGCRSNGFDKESLQLLFLLVGTPRQAQLPISSLSFVDRWDCPEYLCADPDPHGASKFKEFLMRRHKDNGIRAWRRGLDTNSSMRVSWGEFKAAMGSFRDKYPHEISGVNVAGIWRQLDTGVSGWIFLGDFDPLSFELLATFRNWAVQEHGCLMRAYKALLRGAGDPTLGVGRGRFLRLLGETLSTDADSMNMLFDGLNLDGSDRILFEEIRFLEQWNPLADCQEKQNWAKLWGSSAP